jgi:hypothetical protein
MLSVTAAPWLAPDSSRKFKGLKIYLGVYIVAIKL